VGGCESVASPSTWSPLSWSWFSGFALKAIDCTLVVRLTVDEVWILIGNWSDPGQTAERGPCWWRVPSDEWVLKIDQQIGHFPVPLTVLFVFPLRFETTGSLRVADEDIEPSGEANWIFVDDALQNERVLLVVVVIIIIIIIIIKLIYSYSPRVSNRGRATLIIYLFLRLQTRTNALECLDRLIDSLDKMMILEELLPFLTEIQCSDVDIIMSVVCKSLWTRYRLIAAPCEPLAYVRIGSWIYKQNLNLNLNSEFKNRVYYLLIEWTYYTLPNRIANQTVVVDS